jgi:hypothetical protein
VASRRQTGSEQTEGAAGSWARLQRTNSGIGAATCRTHSSRGGREHADRSRVCESRSHEDRKVEDEQDDDDVVQESVAGQAGRDLHDPP